MIDQVSNDKFRNVLRWTTYLFFLAVTGFTGYYYFVTVGLGWVGKPETVRLATIGFSIILSLFVVLMLKFSSGPIEFEVIGFKFKGASGPIIMWVICFLVIVLAFSLLSPKS